METNVPTGGLLTWRPQFGSPSVSEPVKPRIGLQCKHARLSRKHSLSHLQFYHISRVHVRNQVGEAVAGHEWDLLLLQSRQFALSGRPADPHPSYQWLMREASTSINGRRDIHSRAWRMELQTAGFVTHTDYSRWNMIETCVLRRTYSQTHKED